MENREHANLCLRTIDIQTYSTNYTNGLNYDTNNNQSLDNVIGYIDAVGGFIIWKRVNMKLVLGNMWHKYKKFNIRLKSSTIRYNEINNVADAQMVVALKGLNFINNNYNHKVGLMNETIIGCLDLSTLWSRTNNYFMFFNTSITANYILTNMTQTIAPPEGINDTVYLYERENPNNNASIFTNGFGEAGQSIDVGTTVTVSFYAKSEGTTTMFLFLFDTLGGTFSSTSFNVGTEWSRYSLTRTRTTLSANMLATPRARIDNNSGTNEVYITGVQLEIGNTPTEWQPYRNIASVTTPDKNSVATFAKDREYVDLSIELRNQSDTISGGLTEKVRKSDDGSNATLGHQTYLFDIVGVP